jgi:hypothetical protein
MKVSFIQLENLKFIIKHLKKAGYSIFLKCEGPYSHNVIIDKKHFFIEMVDINTRDDEWIIYEINKKIIDQQIIEES